MNKYFECCSLTSIAFFWYCIKWNIVNIKCTWYKKNFLDGLRTVSTFTHLLRIMHYFTAIYELLSDKMQLSRQVFKLVMCQTHPVLAFRNIYPLNVHRHHTVSPLASNVIVTYICCCWGEEWTMRLRVLHMCKNVLDVCAGKNSVLT